MELIDFTLSTEGKALLLDQNVEDYRRYDRSLKPDFQEIHNDRIFLFKERLSPGVYEFDYYVRALSPGKFSHLPARAWEMYFPENFGQTSGTYFEIK
jgi:uncharacterized protein YfaS (alpha-2-macroglobulin family)